MSMAYQETYQYAWMVYLLASIGMYFVVFKLSKYWKSEDRRDYFRMISAVILFTPASHGIEGVSSIAPAYIMVFGELLQNGVKAAVSGLIPMLCALLLGAFALGIQAYIKAKKAASKASQS